MFAARCIGVSLAVFVLLYVFALSGSFSGMESDVARASTTLCARLG